MTRKLAFVGYSYLAGLLVGSFFSLWLSLAAGAAFLCAGICGCLLFNKKSGRLIRFSVFSVSFAAGLLLYSGFDLAFCRPVSANAGSSFAGDCVITEVRRYSSGGAEYAAECTLPDGRRSKISFFLSDEDELVRGDTVALSGTLVLPESGGFFDSRSYYSSKNVFLLLDDVNAEDIYIKENNIFELTDSFRRSVIPQIRAAAEPAGKEAAEAVIGMLFGSGFWDMPAYTESLMYRSGIGHAFSVSGMHMSIIAGVAAAAMNACGFSRRARLCGVIFCSLLFALAADLTVSVMRSLVMIIMVYAAEAAGRKSDPLTSLAAAVILLTVTSPFSVRSASFLLSVSGVMGTAVLAPAVIRRIEERVNARLPAREYKAGAVLSSAVTSLCACAAVFPVSAVSFDEISVISPVSNMLLSPLCSMAVAISAAAAAISFLPAPIDPSGALFCAAGYICKAVTSAAGVLGSLPLAAIPCRMDITVLLLSAAAAATALCAAAVSDRTYALLAFIGSVFICTLSLTAYRLIPRDGTQVAVLTEGKGCVIVVSDGVSSQIYDFMGTSRGASAAKSYIAQTGAGEPAAVMVTKYPEKAQQLYEERFPNAAIISPNEKNRLTYSGEDTIIKVGNCEIIPQEGYCLFNVEGADIICINSGCEPPDREFDLAVYNCTAPVSADSSAYVVAKRSFSGMLPASAECTLFTSAVYTAANGGLYPEEETGWLR